MMKLVAPITKTSSAYKNAQDSDSETDNISAAQTSTPVKTNTGISKTTLINSGNTHFSNMMFLKFSQKPG